VYTREDTSHSNSNTKPQLMDCNDVGILVQIFKLSTPAKKFEMMCEDGQQAFLRIYTKDMKYRKGVRIRKEHQEYPNKRLDDAMRGN
jgi:hypothetical protein